MMHLLQCALIEMIHCALLILMLSALSLITN